MTFQLRALTRIILIQSLIRTKKRMKLDTQKWIESWNLLRNLQRKFQSPWLCVGDFIKLVRGEEKMGVIEEVTTRCNYSVMQSMLVILWILGTWVQDSLGVNTIQLANQFGRD